MSSQTNAVLLVEWHHEYTALTIPQRMAVEHDYANASQENRDAYRHNIGAGNLASYANSLIVGHLMAAGLS